MSGHPPVRVSLLQTAADTLNVGANLRVMDRAAAEAKADEADLLVTPELFTTGYAPRQLVDLGPDDSSEIEARCAEIARRHQIAIVASWPEVLADGTRYIAAALWDKTGHVVLKYRKGHLWGDDEAAVFTASADAPSVAQWHGITVGLLICFDIEFPEPARHLAREGARLIFVPSALGVGAEHVPELMVPARAIENYISVVYVNHLDPDAGLIGLSRVIGAGGSVTYDGGAVDGVGTTSLQLSGSTNWNMPDYLFHAPFDRYAAWQKSADL